MPNGFVVKIMNYSYIPKYYCHAYVLRILKNKQSTQCRVHFQSFAYEYYCTTNITIHINVLEYY